MLIHIYGVVPASAELPAGLTGRGGQPVRRIGDEDLMVLVSDVDDDARVRREDLLTHAHLLERLSETCTVIPSSFGVLLPDDETVRRELLGNQRERLLGLLRAFEGSVQVTVHASYDEEAALREVLQRDQDLADLREAAVDSSDPATQLRLGEAVAEALSLLRDETADLVIERLRAHAQAVALNEPRGAYDVANVAVLVARGHRQKLDAAVGELAQELQGRVNLRYVGPQPPYAFLDHVVTEEESWA